MRSTLTAAGTALALAVLLLVPAASPAVSASPSPPANVYRIGILEDYDGINPFSSWSGPSWECFRLSYDFLTWYDQDYKPVPALARRWETSADGRTWTFHIIEGMRWQDGAPLTARDIAFTYNLVRQTQDAAFARYLAGVTSVTAPDDVTLVIRTRKPDARMLALYIPILPEHVWRSADPENLGGFNNWPLVGSGPFRVAEMEKGKWIMLEANKSYPRELGGPPAIDQVYFVIGANADATIQSYRAGDLDAVVGWPASYYRILKTLPATTAVAAPAIGFHELGFNCWASPRSSGDPLLRDVAVRRAIAWAVDRGKVAATSMAGLAVPGTSLISPAQGFWHWEVPAAKTISYDPGKADQLLQDAGYVDHDGDGVRENAKGRQLDFRLATLNEYPEDQTAGKLIVSWCADIGIRLRLEQMNEAAFGDRVYDNADYDMFIWSWRGDVDPGFMLSTFTSAEIQNWGDTQYSNPRFDALCAAQWAAVDPVSPDNRTARKALTDRMQAVLYRDSPYVILWYNVNLQAFRTDRWSGYRTVPAGGGAPFFNMTRATYVDLRPKTTDAVAQVSGGSAWAAIIAAAAATVVVAAAVLAVVVRRRPRRSESA